MVLTEESKCVYFLQQICSDLESRAFKTPWGSLLLHNCHDDGKLLKYESVQDYKDSGRSLWLDLKLVLFRKDRGVFPVWCCPQCPSMRGFTSLGVQNNEEDLSKYLCIHSKAASFLLPDWETIWNVGLAPGVSSHEVFCNEDISVVTCKEYKKGQLFLAAVLAEGKVHVLYTVTTRQTAPTCSTYPAPFCSTQKCKHFRNYVDVINKEGYKSVFCPKFGRNETEEEDRQNINDEQDQQDEGDAPENESSDNFEHDTESVFSKVPHYLHKLGNTEFAKICGYNFSKIPYPFKRSKAMQTVWLKRQKHIYDLPAVFIPEYSDDNRCDKHGNVFDHNNAHLMKESENTIVFNEIGDQTFETVVMYRRTIGNCT